MTPRLSVGGRRENMVPGHSVHQDNTSEPFEQPTSAFLEVARLKGGCCLGGWLAG